MSAATPAAGGAVTATGGTLAARRGHRALALVVVLSAVFMQLLDTTIVTVAIPSIQDDLGAGFGTVQLVLAGYSLTFACTLITGGRLGDSHGRRRLFLIGMLGFVLTSALCGAAPDATTLVVARLVQGMCSGLMFPQVLAIIQSLYDERSRPKALGAYGAAIGLATISGPVLGGALIAADVLGTGWRAIFYLNLPIGALALAGALRVLPETYGDRGRRLDLAGALLVTGGLFLLVLPLVVGRDQGWPVWAWVLLALSVPVLGAFAAQQRRLGRRADSDPLIRPGLFARRSFSVGLAVNLVFFAGIPSFFFLFILTLQAGFGYSAVGAGTVTLGFAVFVALASARSSAVVRRLGTRTLSLGTALLVAGMTGVLLTLHAAGTGLHGYQLLPSLAVAGIGAGLFLAPVTGVVTAGLPRRDAGSASGVLATAQQVGAALGIAVAGVIFFGLLGGNAQRSVDAVTPELHQRLTAARLTADQQRDVLAGFTACFADRAHATDPAATPASCARMTTRAAAAPADVRAAVQRAVVAEALPQARRHDFSRSLQQALGWQVGVFALSFLLVAALPRVRGGDVTALPAA
ncbi:MFS transporter [Streptomyces sp. NPDC021020]|uniref:MFS transporter n=1 Tax=Streptomyces sp. NPDC021020 TaxID=3365109 RepID=UPI00379C6C90